MNNFKAHESNAVGSYYGMLTILEYNNKFYIAVQNHCGYSWTEIKEAYYNQTLKCKALQMKEVPKNDYNHKEIIDSLNELETKNKGAKQ